MLGILLSFETEASHKPNFGHISHFLTTLWGRIGEMSESKRRSVVGAPGVLDFRYVDPFRNQAVRQSRTVLTVVEDPSVQCMGPRRFLTP